LPRKSWTRMTGHVERGGERRSGKVGREFFKRGNMSWPRRKKDCLVIIKFEETECLNPFAKEERQGRKESSRIVQRA